MSASGFRTGNGADWLDFLATLLGRYKDEQVEMLGSPDDLRAWLRDHGLEPAAGITSSDLEVARSLREGLHRLATATVRGEAAATSDVRLLNEVLSGAASVQVRRKAFALTTTRPASTSAALARLAHQAAMDLTGPARERLRFCGDDTCSGVFLDHSGRRRWCSDERCGVRARVRAHRARARAHA
jgi:predicted RNA-binding Zn ribbon-like protein